MRSQKGGLGPSIGSSWPPRSRAISDFRPRIGHILARWQGDVAALRVLTLLRGTRGESSSRKFSGAAKNSIRGVRGYGDT
jgi:hypothetical protein